MNKNEQSNEDKIEKILLQESKDGELPCAIAFDIADKHQTSPAVIGECADRLKIRLVKCQMGLFGYQPEKKIVKPSVEVGAELGVQIEEALIVDRLPCASAWNIAEKLGVAKMEVSSACEAMGIKIKPCQLGAF
jgi:hypothetical protein